MSKLGESPSALDVAAKILGIAVSAATLFTVIYGSASGSFTIVWGFAFSHPGESLMWSLLSILSGALIGCAVTRFIYKNKIDEAVEEATKPLQERIDRILNRENFALMRLRGLSLKELGIIKGFITQGGEAYLKVNDASVRKLADAGFIHVNNETYCPPDLYPFTLDDSIRSLIIEFPDTLDRAIAEAESVKERYSCKER